MIIRRFKAVAFFFFIMVFFPGAISAGESNRTKDSEYISNKLLVKFYPEITDEKKTAIREELGAELIKCLKEIGVEVWKLPVSLSIDDAIVKLKEEASVEYSEPDYKYKPLSTPDDSKFKNIWHPINSGKETNGTQSAFSGGEWGHLSGKSINYSRSLSDNIGSSFTATAAYGSYDHPDVVLLRNIRDRYILKFDLGRRFVSVYYSLSPPLVRFVKRHEILRYASKAALFPVVIFSRLLIGFGLMFIAAVASIGYLLPFSLFFIMAREKRG